MKKAISAVSAIALCAVATAPAFADTLPAMPAQAVTAETLALMQERCDEIAASYDENNGDLWSGVATPTGSSILVSGPDEVAQTRSIEMNTVTGIESTFTPSVTSISGNPFRNGGSVNMFGHQIATAGYYGDSTYFFTADFDSTYDHGFSCAVSKRAYNEGTEAIAPDGWYTNPGHPVWEGEINLTICANGEGHPWGTSYGQCVFHPGPYQEGTPSFYSPLEYVTTENDAVGQDQTDLDVRGYEDHGGYYEITGEKELGKVVICISPSTTAKKTASNGWATQNGYTGDKCTTTWFNSAEAMNVPNLNLQGTFISVPPVS